MSLELRIFEAVMKETMDRKAIGDELERLRMDDKTIWRDYKQACLALIKKEVDKG
jgi:hypothetical protein